jgi:hypothetical protein
MIKAYSIALIPPREIIETCIKINESIENRENIDFRRHGQLPHITLLMGGVETSDIKRISSMLNEVINKTEPVAIKLTGIHVGEFASGIVIEDNPNLYQLHVDVVTMFKKFFNEPVTIQDIIGLPNVTEGTAKIINNYRNKSILNNFDPHITIGDGIPIVDENVFPIVFKSNDIQLAPIGNYCTFIGNTSLLCGSNISEQNTT